MAASEHFVIAGVVTTKDGKGNAIEMDPMDKVKIAVGLAAADYDSDFNIWCKELSYGPVRFTQKGDLLNRKFQHNDYTAEGTGMFTYLRKTDASQSIIGPKKRAFKIEFYDALNRYGAPGLEIKSFTLEPTT